MSLFRPAITLSLVLALFAGCDTFQLSEGSTGGAPLSGAPPPVTPGAAASWTPMGAMASPRASHTATRLSQGTVLLVGGSGSNGSGTTAEEYDPATGTFRLTGSLALPRSGHTATLLTDGRVLVAGGHHGGPQAAEEYAPATATWRRTGLMVSSRSGHTATLLPDGKVLVVGGSDGSSSQKTAEVYDPATGTWSATGPMASPREGHTATLLSTGKVLVTGGLDFFVLRGSAQATAEEYDPATGTWSATNSLSGPRYAHTATLLYDGKVLVSGGLDGSGYLATAEVYEPVTGLWSSTGSLATPRKQHTATLLTDGKVLVSGGLGTGPLAAAEVYDPVTGLFSPTRVMGAPRSWHTATLLTDGKVLVSGGLGTGAQTTAEVYDPALVPPGGSITGSARLAIAIPSAPPGDIARVTVTVLASDMPPVSTELVLTEGTWSGVLGDIPAGPHRTFLAQAFTASHSLRHQGRAQNVTVPAGTTRLVSLTLQANEAPLLDSLVANPLTVVPGGSISLAARAHDPNTDDAVRFAWTVSGGTLGTASSGTSLSEVSWTAPTACVDPGTMPRITVTVTDALGLKDTRSFTVAGLPACTTANWRSTGAMASPRSSHTATRLSDGKVLIAGGSLGHGSLAAAEVYEPATGTFIPTGSLVSPRRGHTATLLTDGRVLVAGGSGGSGCLAAAEVYEPATGTWSATGPMTAPRCEHTATLLVDGKVLVSGGVTADRGDGTSEVYDPATGTWSATGPMSARRRQHTATLLADGKVLVSGGFTFDLLRASNWATAEVYEPATGTWRPTGAMATSRRLHTATPLPDGTVLVAGGFGPSADMLATAEVYDPATGTWSATGSLASPRRIHTATPLPDGTVLVAGGNESTWSTAEVYEPAMGTWRPTRFMSAPPRTAHTATPLSNGRVLVVGGHISGTGSLAAAEVYEPDAGN